VKVHFPYIESACEHDGDVNLVATWLFDWLDRNSPGASPVGDANRPDVANLTLYLCYHPYDQGFFFSSDRNEVLAAALMKVYERERELDHSGYGDLLFDLTLDGKRADCPKLTYRRSKAVLLLEICWHPTASQTIPGLLGLAHRRERPMNAGKPLAAVLSVEYGAEIARHVDRWQLSARWHKPVIYLPREGKTLLLGEDVGCDLYTPNLPSPLAITYDGASNEWSWRVIGEEWDPTGLQQDRQRGSLYLRYEREDEDYPVAFALRGGPLLPPRSLIDLERENRLDSFRVEIVGCLLPLSHPHGYGVVPNDIPAQIRGRIQTAIKLPGGGWLYFDEIAQATYVLFRGDDPRRLAHGMTVTMSLPENVAYEPLPTVSERIARAATILPPVNAGKKLSGKWLEFPSSSKFHGELQLDQPIVATLARGSINIAVPNDLFADYRDSTLGRAPARIISEDGRQHKLVFNESAKHPLIIQQKWYHPNTATAIDLAPQDQFILGATRYRLRRIEEMNDILNIEAE